MNVPAVAVNVVLVIAAGTTTCGGTPSTALLLDTVTEAPPAGTVLFIATVQVVVPPGPTPEGVHASEEMTAGATNEIVALVELVL
jgi:hypothetical protein